MMRLYLVLVRILCSVGLVHKIGTKGEKWPWTRTVGRRVSWTASGKEGLLEADLQGNRGKVKSSLWP